MSLKPNIRMALEAAELRVEARYDEPMSRHTSLGIGGPADVFVPTTSEEELDALLKVARSADVDVLAVGGGTNLLVRDRGIRGLTVNTRGLDTVETIEEKSSYVYLRVGAGARLQGLISHCRREGLSGLEALAGIPGMVGGAAVGNAGSFGTEMKDVFVKARVMGLDGKVTDISNEDAGFTYRASRLGQSGIITALVLRFERRDAEDVSKLVDDYLARKQKTQPIGERSAGCVFRNPEGDSAGRLIDEASCKGMREGDIEVCRVHANFFVNRGKGRAEDFIRLMERVAEKVYDASRVELKPEIRVVGE